MPFISENELEKALVKAVKSPALAPDFYRLLLESDLLVLGTAQGREETVEQFTMAPGGKFNLVTGRKDGAAFLPVFSSLLRMQEYVQQESKFLRINGRALLDLTRGARVTLNPASEYGKEFSPEEVARLLDPRAAHRGPGIIVGEAQYPMPLVEILLGVFTTRPDIEAAWMIQVKFADRDQPHPVVGVETRGDWSSLMQAVVAAAEPAIPGMVFDFLRVDRSQPNSMTDTLLQVPPFYRRGHGSVVN